MSRSLVSPDFQTSAEHPQALLAILIGPSAARPGGKSSGAGGYADVFNLKTITVPSLAFAATIVVFLSGTDFTLISFDFFRHDMHSLRNKSVSGHLMVMHEDSITWYSTSESSQRSEHGVRKTGSH